jgi:hypothetical protein
MLHVLALIALALPPLQSPPPDPAAVRTAVAQLKEAFEHGKAPDRVIAIEKSAGLVDAGVIEWVAKGLKDGEKSVQTAAIEMLRHLRHADALAALLGTFERDKKLQKDAELYVKLVKAIGQHASPAAAEKLAAGGVDGSPGPVIEARILAVANVRTPQAVEILIGMLRSAGRERVAPYLGTFRLALMRLTGDDAGHSEEAWIEWWNEHKKDLKIAPEAPKLPKELQLRWDYFWGNEVDLGRAKKRGDRGDDPGGKK